MAFINHSVVFALRKIFPTEDFELDSTGKTILINGKPFFSAVEGEVLEVFAKIGEGYQNSVIAKMTEEVAAFLEKEGKKAYAAAAAEVSAVEQVVEKVEDAVKNEVKVVATAVDAEAQKVLASVDDDESDKE